MPDIVSIFSVGGSGAPLLSKEILLASMLIEAGYILLPATVDQKNFQDATNEKTGERRFVFLFSPAERINWGDGLILSTRDFADLITRKTGAPICAEMRKNGLSLVSALEWRADVYAAYHGSRMPVKELSDLSNSIPASSEAAFGRLVTVHREFLAAVKQAPRHIECQRGRARVWVNAALSPEEREREIRRILAA